MTAFGSGTFEGNGLTVTCEIKTLNSRFLEVNVRLPRSLMFAETNIIKYVKSKLKRGKVDVSFDLKYESNTDSLPSLNKEAVLHYVNAIQQISSLAATTPSAIDLTSPNIVDVMKLEGVMTSEKRKIDGEEIESSGLKAAAVQAIDQVIEARQAEGSSLNEAFQELLSDLIMLRKDLIDQLPTIREFTQENYKKRLEKVVGDLNDKGFKADMPKEERLLSELSVLIDKIDIEEEITRLETHFNAFQDLLSQGDGVGRKLDFLCQELHREVNTISSKLHHSSVAGKILDMKQIVEKIRQQVQNIE